MPRRNSRRSGFFFGMSKAASRDKPARLAPPRAGKGHEGRADIEREADEDGDRIAGQAEHHAVADLTEIHRPAGLDRDLPQVALCRVRQARRPDDPPRPVLAPPLVMMAS
jgi:hypothetical protein